MFLEWRGQIELFLTVCRLAEKLAGGTHDMLTSLSEEGLVGHAICLQICYSTCRTSYFTVTNRGTHLKVQLYRNSHKLFSV
jgi:hypothetical protein